MSNIKARKYINQLFGFCEARLKQKILQASSPKMTAQRLQDKICIVTGSSSGLGRAISLGYSQQGASLVCADLKPTARSEVPSEVTVPTDELIRQNGGNAIFVRTDVSKVEDWEALVNKAVETYGRIDVQVE